MSPRERNEQRGERNEQERKRKRRRRAFRERSKKRQPGQAHTILSFCLSNMISESKYYELKRKKKNPREIELDGRIIITPEAEQDWRREREQETAERRANKDLKSSRHAP